MTNFEILLVVGVVAIFFLFALFGLGYILFRVINEQNRLINRIADRFMARDFTNYATGESKMLETETEAKRNISKLSQRFEEEARIATDQRLAEAGLITED